MQRFTLHLALAALAVLGLAVTSPAQTPVQLPVPVETGPIVLVPPVMPAQTTVKAMTLREFACSDFCPGKHSVFLIHPCTNSPVKVCFCLPVCPRKVRMSCNTVELRWGLLCRRAVVIHFLADGTVSVRG